MAKMKTRGEALLNAYLNKYVNAQSSTVSGGQTKQKKAQSSGSAIMNATDKTLPEVTDYTDKVYSGIIDSSNNEQSDMTDAAIAQAKAEKEAAETAAKAAASATKSTTKSSSKSSSSSDDSGVDSDEVEEKLAATNSKTTKAKTETKTETAEEEEDEKNGTSATAKKTLAEQLKEKQNTAKTTTDSKKTYAETGTTAEKKETVKTARGSEVGSSYAAAAQAPTETEKEAAQEYKQTVSDTLEKLRGDNGAEYLEELAQNGRKLTDAEIEAVTQYAKEERQEKQAAANETAAEKAKEKAETQPASTYLTGGDSGFADLGETDEIPVLEKSDETEKAENLNRAASKAALGGLGQTLEAAAAGILNGIPFLNMGLGAVEKGLDAATGGQYYDSIGGEENSVANTLNDVEDEDTAAGSVGRMAASIPLYGIVNDALEGTKLAGATQSIGAGIANKLGLSKGVGESIGNVLLGQAADTVLDTVPSLTSDLVEYSGQKSREDSNREALNNAVVNSLQPSLHAFSQNQSEIPTLDLTESEDTLTGSDIAKNLAANVGLNLAGNILGEAFPALVSGTKSALDSAGTAKSAAEQADDTLLAQAYRSSNDDVLRQSADALNADAATYEIPTLQKSAVGDELPVDTVPQEAYNVAKQTDTGGVTGGTTGIDAGRTVQGIEQVGTGNSDGYVQGGRAGATDQGVFRQPVISDEGLEAIRRSGSSWGKMAESTAEPQRFSDALSKARIANKFGAMVSPKSVDELTQPGVKTFMSSDGLSGVSVNKGDIEAVFKDPSSKMKRASTQLMLTAIDNGGVKLDCFGDALAKIYSKYGMEAVSRTPYQFGIEGQEATDELVRQLIDSGYYKEAPNVYAMKLGDGLTADDVAKQLDLPETDGGFHIPTSEELAALPSMDYDASLEYRNSLIKPSASTAGGVSMPSASQAEQTIPTLEKTAQNAAQDEIPMIERQTAESVSEPRPLNGSESVPENAVGAHSTMYDRSEVPNQDLANRRATQAQLGEEQLAAYKESYQQPTHTVWSDKEAIDQAKQDIDLYIQQAGGDTEKGLRAAMSDLTSADGVWNKGQQKTASEIKSQLANLWNRTEKDTPEWYTMQAAYKDWDATISDRKSLAGQALQAGKEDAGKTAEGVYRKYQSDITEKFAKANPRAAKEADRFADELDALRKELDAANQKISDLQTEKAQKQVAEALQNYVDGTTEIPTLEQAGDMDAEFDDFLKSQGVKTDVDANFKDTCNRIKKLAEKNKVTLTDEQVKSFAGQVMNGSAKESYYNSLLEVYAGFPDVSVEKFTEWDDMLSTAATMADSKERWQLEQQVYAEMADYLPSKSLFDKIDNFRYLAMLGNTRTHVRNLMGNVGMMTVTRVKDEVEAGLQKLLPQEQRTKSLFVPKDMKQAASDYLDSQVYSRVLKGDNDKYGLGSVLNNQKTYGNSLGGKTLQKLTDLNSELLNKEDEAFMRSGFVRSLASNLNAKGYGTEIFDATDSTSKRVLDAAVESAIKDAKEMTFHTENKYVKKIKEMLNTAKSGNAIEKTGYILGSGAMPFMQTPVNIAKQSLAYNPVAGVAGAISSARKGDAVGVTDWIAKGAVGTGAIALGYVAADRGWLNAKSSENSDYDEMLGAQEYAINLPESMGGGTYTLDWLSPSIVPIMIGAQMAQDGVNISADDLDDLFSGETAGEAAKSAASGFFGALKSSLDPVMNMSLVSSLDDTLKSLRYLDDDDSALGTLGAEVAKNYATQYIPTLLGQVARTVDDTRRSTYGGGQTSDERDLSYLINKLENKIPVLSQSNEEYVDQWGRTEQNLDSTGSDALGTAARLAYNMLSPGYYSAENTTPVDEYVQDLYSDTGESGVIPQLAKSYVTQDGSKYYMTPEEKTTYAKTSGQTAYNVIDQLRQNDAFTSLPTDQQAEIVQEVYTTAKTIGGVAAVGDTVSGTNKKAYQAYEQGGQEGLIDYLLAKNAVSVAEGDDGKISKAETWDAVSEDLEGDSAVSAYLLNNTDDVAQRVYDAAGATGATAYLDAYSAIASTLDEGTPSESAVENELLSYGLDSKDFAEVCLAMNPDDEKNATVYDTYGAEALQEWVRFKAVRDVDGDGTVTKAEATAVLDQMDLTDELRRAYLTLQNKKWKNPY